LPVIMSVIGLSMLVIFVLSIIGLLATLQEIYGLLNYIQLLFLETLKNMIFSLSMTTQETYYSTKKWRKDTCKDNVSTSHKPTLKTHLFNI